jgi:hypothetical protein
MAYCIDPLRHSADNHNASGGNLAAEAFRHLRTIQGRAARAHNGYARLIECLHVAAHIQQYRRVVNLQESLGIFRFCPVQQTAVIDAPGEC